MEIPGIVVADSVDEEGRRNGDAVAATLPQVLLHASARRLAVEIAAEPIHVQPEAARKIEHALAPKRRFLLVEPIVHFPKSSLRGGGLRRAREQVCPRMHGFVRQMAKNVQERITKRRAQLRE